MLSNPQTPIAPRDHFSSIVPNWAHLGPPLRPAPDDSAVVQRVVAGLGGAAHAVVLGLTPEIIACDWPADVQLSAVDHSPPMIQALWPPAKCPPQSEVILGNWCAMPFASDSIDLVAGDGCYVLQTYPDGYASLTQEVGRVLKPGGVFVSWDPNPFNPVILYRYLATPRSPNQFIFWPHKVLPLFKSSGLSASTKFFYARLPWTRNRFLGTCIGIVAHLHHKETHG